MLSDDSAGLDVYRKRKLNNVEDDKDVRNLVFDLIHMDDTISDLTIQSKVIEEYGNRYPSMQPNDWRHIIEDYTPMVRETLSRKAKEVVLQLKKAAEDRTDDEISIK